jgi:serine/threonine-protein kinase
MLAVAGASTWTVAAIKSHVNKAPGSATSTTPPLPTASAAQSGCIARVEAGPRSTCAIRNDGNVYCWGSNTSGLFAPKGAATLPRPTPLAGIRSPVALALGARVAFAIVDEGLFGWGESFSGVLGQSVPVGEHRSSDNSVTVFPAGVTSVAVEGLASNIACAVRGREVLCWGGQSTSLNLPLTMEAHPAPVKIALPPDPLGGTMRVIGVSPLGFACARSEAFLWCWGNQQMTKMQPKALPNDLPWGFGTFSSGDVAEGEGAVGGEAVCSDSACIGGNVNCDLGNGAPSDDVTTTPQSVGRPLASIHSGGSFFCGLLDGDVLCWGNNLAGQILQGEARICRPHKAGLPKAKSIALGSAHSCVVTLAGEVYCRGDNKAGQRGCEPDATGACRVDVPCD